MCKIIVGKSGRLGRVLEIQTYPDRGGGGWWWFENPRFWRTSFVDGPYVTCLDTLKWMKVK